MTLREILALNTNIDMFLDLNVYTGEMICGVRMEEVDDKYLDLKVTSFNVYPDGLVYNGEFVEYCLTMQVVLDPANQDCVE